METLVIDASIAMKWVVEEEGTQAALGLRSSFRFVAPELFIAECAHILWKKVRRGELMHDEAVMAGKLLMHSGVEFLSMRGLLEQMTLLAIDLSHPAYDCAYLVAARQIKARFVTADQRLLRVVGERPSRELAGLCVALTSVHMN